MSFLKANLISSHIQKMSFGANVLENGAIHFQLPASAKNVELILLENSAIKLPLVKQSTGLFELITDLASIGQKYQYLIDEKTIVADPASRFQPEGVHGPSQIIDPYSFNWTDANWMGKPWHETIIYELHTGTFTEHSSFQAIVPKLDELISLGITAIELMPIAEFPGNRNWGYDGTFLFAPAHCYGSPNDLKELVNACHKKGLMIFLDVVYNHFGPEGNYLPLYADYFFTDKYKTPWGKAINYDGPNSHLVREFFINNAFYWLNEYHFDGLRLDAVHAINDTSNKYIINEICERIDPLRESGRHIHIILENDANNASFLQRNKNNEPIVATAQWNDDMHHILHVIATGEKEGYYADYTAPAIPKSVTDTLGRALTEGFIYQGEISQAHAGNKRGEPSKHLPPVAFISFLQNHDQTGNRAFGERIEMIAILEKLKAILSIFLLSPEIPMLFMGEEWAASSPFYYFCNMGDELSRLITKGRREEFKQFATFNDPKKLELIPDPCSIETFKSSVLNWQERKEANHKDWLLYYKFLLKLRKEHVIPILSEIISGKGDFKSSDGMLEVNWPLKDKRELKLIANLSDENMTISMSSAKRVKPFFQRPDNCCDNFNSGYITPYSTLWFFE